MLEVWESASGAGERLSCPASPRAGGAERGVGGACCPQSFRLRGGMVPKMTIFYTVTIASQRDKTDILNKLKRLLKIAM